jgi:hypothetical protein
MQAITRKRSNLRIVVLCLLTTVLASFVCLQSTLAQYEPAMREVHRSTAIGKIKDADTAAIDCSVCPRDLEKVGKTASQQLLLWKRFRIVNDPKKADVLFLFSANPYLGDYVKRDGPDKRVVRIEGTIMTVIDPHTGEELWTDGRRWGSWFVEAETRALIDQLRTELEGESTTWTIDDVLSCRNTPAYEAFASLTPDAALTRSGVSRIPDADDRLNASAPDAPDFCKRVRLVIGSDNKVTGFEVVGSASDTLDVADILEKAEEYEYSGVMEPASQKRYFTAQSRDKKLLIQFQVLGHRTVLSRVAYSY